MTLLAISLWKYNYTENTQVQTTRKTSSWFGNAYDAGVAYVGTPRRRIVLIVEDFSMMFPTTGKWYQQQINGMKLRMGVLRFKNKALTSQMVMALDSMIENEWLMATGDDHRE